MSAISKRYHSVIFGEKNSWDDWHMIPINRPVIALPELKYVSVDLAGADGEIDLSEALTAYPVYENRKGSLKFRIIDDLGNEKRTLSRGSEIANYLHGKRMRMILEEDQGYFYIGRFEVEELKYKKHHEWADITISYNLEPYKYELLNSTEDWLWDPFNFETGVIRGYKNIEISESGSVLVSGSRKPVTPILNVVTSDNDFSVTVYGNTYPLSNGRNIIAELVLGEYETYFYFNGTGTVTISFRGGSL